jgi:sulfite exporter TauE/SafE
VVSVKFCFVVVFGLLGLGFVEMSVLEQFSNPYFASLVFGVLYGLTFCASSCLPYVVSYIAGVGAGFKKGAVITVVYNSGRVVAYAIIGTAVGLISTVISEETFASYTQYSSIAFSLIVIAIGVAILLRKVDTTCSCNQQQTNEKFGISKLTNRIDLRAFFMGFTRGLILCPPLVALLLYSVTVAHVNPTLMAVLFGTGTALSPVILLGGATGWLLNKATLWRTWLRRIGALALILMGLSVLLGALMEII